MAATGVMAAVRRRVRLRTRLRRVREAWLRARPRRLPQWSDSGSDDAGMPAVPAGDHLTVTDVSELSRFAAAATEVKSLRLTVTEWSTPWRGWSGRLGPLPGVLGHELRLPAGGRGPATVTVALAEPVPVGRIVAAMRPALTPDAPLPRPASADPAPVSTPPAGTGRQAIVVDARAANPRGRHRYGPPLPTGRLTVTADRWEIARDNDGVTVVAGRVGTPLDRRQSTVLTELAAATLVTGPSGAESASSAAPVLAQLAMTGLVLHAPAADRLAPELAALLAAPLPVADADPLEWETRSVAQRRTAMRHHASAFRPPPGHPGLASPPSVSALLVTRRPKLVAAAVAAMTAQTYPALEVVVALHGAELPSDVTVPGPVLQVPAQWSFGEALGAATAAASGSLVTKVDDDDRYGPEHIWDLVLARHYSGATVVGKPASFVYLEPKDLTVRRRMGCEDFTDTVAGGTILIGRGDLEAVGGWPPVPASVDRALLDRVIAGGGSVYRTHPIGFVYTRHGAGHTWDPGLDYFLTDPLRTWPGLPPHPEFETA